MLKSQLFRLFRVPGRPAKGPSSVLAVRQGKREEEGAQTHTPGKETDSERYT